jgi:5-methylcytosine-specific restriction endonuclease McrA
MQIQKTTRSGKTKKGSNKKKSRKQKGPMTNPLSEEEIAHHVAEVYRHTSSPDMLSRTRRKKSAEEALKNRERDAMDALINPIHGEHVKFLRQLDGHPVLVLNANYQPLSYAPLSLWSWQDAVKAVFNGKVSVVETYSDVLIRAPSLDMILPSVIALKAFVPKAYQSRPSFTRRNVFLRDGYKCQYCSQRFSTGDLSLDHVVPRCRGGTLNWDNAVSCCKKCNGRKGSLMPTDLRSVGMALLRQPRCPTQYELGVEKGKIAPKSCHPTWEPYIQ